jgi:hypothetical protein
VSPHKNPKTLGESRAILRHWLEAVPNDRLAHLIRDAARGLARGLQLRLTEHAVSFGHWALSERVGVMESTTAVALRALEGLGYVTRKKRAGNRRNLYVFLTPAGSALKAKLVPLAEDVNAVAFRGIAPAQVAVVRNTLLQAILNLAEDEAAHATSLRRVPSTRALSRVINAAPKRSRTAAPRAP